VAPVFLLNGIAGLLGTFSARLGSLIDRIRIIFKRRWTGQHWPGQGAEVGGGVNGFRRRRLYLINRAIPVATITALLIAVCCAVCSSAVVAVMNLGAIVVPIFVLAMLSLIASLLLFFCGESAAGHCPEPPRY